MFSVLFMIWLVLKPGTPSLFIAIDNVAQFVGPLLVIPWCFMGKPLNGASRLPAAQRWVPVLLGLGALCEAMGQVIYTIYQQVLHYATVPFPSIADAVYLWAYPFMLLGILFLSGRRLPGASGIRVLLDGLMVMTAVFTFSWYFILGPTIAQSGGTPLSTVVGLAYPLGDLVLIACLLLLGARVEDPALRPIVALLSCALGVIVLTDTVYDYQTLHGGYSTGGLLDLGWPLGYMLVALSGQALRRTWVSDALSTAADQSPDGLPRLWASLLPAALVPAVGILLLYTRFAGGTGQYDLGVTIGALVLIAIIVLHQVLTILDNRRLYVLLDSAFTAQGLTLSLREQQIHTVMANAPIILTAVDRTGVCTLYEGQALAVLGHTPTSMWGNRSLRSIVRSHGCWRRSGAHWRGMTARW